MKRLRPERVEPMRLGASLLLALLLSGCETDMYDQAKYQPYEAGELFADGQSARQPVAETVARGSALDLRTDRSPFPVSAELLQRGEERFGIYCSPCHGILGDGQGMNVRRGFPPPPTFHQPRLRVMPDAYFYLVITHGFGIMYSYASRVDSDDRWAIVAYIRALQLSQNATIEEVPEGVSIPASEERP